MNEEVEDVAVHMIRAFIEEEAGNTSSAEVLMRTPQRFVDMFREMMGENDTTWDFTTFQSDCDEMVIVKDISFVSLCEHHMLPFIGTAHIAYIPQGKIAGLSKLARVVQSYSRGLWTQEHLTLAIAEFLHAELNPLGVGVVMEAEHTCMTIRGVKAIGTRTTTSAMNGVFRENGNNARAEFLSLIR